jgi:hypothetical protein
VQYAAIEQGMISDQHRCIFVHIPKCGGTSIEDVIWPPPRRESDLWMGFIDTYHNKYQTGGLQHLTATQIRSEVGEVRFAAYWRFSIVRNPFDRLVSQYASMPRRPDLCDLIGFAPDGDFSTYLHAIARKAHVQWMAQEAFLTDRDGRVLVDTLYRYENFEQDASVIFARLGLAATMVPHANRGERGPYQDYYGAAERRFVADRFAADLARFGYQF